MDPTSLSPNRSQTFPLRSCLYNTNPRPHPLLTGRRGRYTLFRNESRLEHHPASITRSDPIATKGLFLFPLFPHLCIPPPLPPSTRHLLPLFHPLSLSSQCLSSGLPTKCSTIRRSSPTRRFSRRLRQSPHMPRGTTRHVPLSCRSVPTRSSA